MNNYQKFLISWIKDINNKNKDSFNYDNIKDMAIGIYLLCKDFKVDPVVECGDYIRMCCDINSYNNLIEKLVVDITSRNPDLLELIKEISFSNYNINQYASFNDFNGYIETLYNNDKISEEENKETLIFGDNILDGEMSPRELSDIVRTMSKEYVEEYITDFNIGDITFTISDDSIMYLKDTDGVKLATVYTKDGNKHIIRYTNENGSALFLLFEPSLIKTETIYGLSLDTESDGRRGLLILEKNKDDSVYKLLFGRGDF